MQLIPGGACALSARMRLTFQLFWAEDLASAYERETKLECERNFEYNERKRS